MKFGVLIPNWAPFDQKTMIRVGLEAEELGFDHLLYTDHLMNPHAQSDNFPDTTVEAWSLISYMGAKTSRIRLGAGVSAVGLRSPAMLAKQAATVDNLIDGRLDLGLGTGWAPGSFGLLGQELGSLTQRLDRFGEGVNLMRRLWLEDTVVHHGEYFTAKDAVLAPKPQQRPYPPLLIGGFGPRMLAYTAEFGDAWIPWHRSVETYASCWKVIESTAGEKGRKSPIIAGSVVMVVPDQLGDVVMDMGQGPPPNLVVSQVSEVLAAYAEVGCELFIFFLFPADCVIDTLRAIARRVI